MYDFHLKKKGKVIFMSRYVDGWMGLAKTYPLSAALSS